MWTGKHLILLFELKLVEMSYELIWEQSLI